MDNRYIGVFDSGLGGLTVVRELMHILPDENIVYFGDTGRVPYGTRSDETIIKYVTDDIRFLLKQNIKLIVCACGTASSVALEVVAPRFDVPIIGVVAPAAERAALSSKNGRIGVLGTPGTINSRKYEFSILARRPEARVFSVACPLFVPLVENGHTNTQVTRLVADEYLAPLKDKDLDTIVLGCTHYPLLKECIRDIMGEGIQLINPGEETARITAALLESEGMLSGAPLGDKQYKFFVTDSPGSFSRLGGMFLNRNLDYEVHKVSVSD